MAGSNKHVVVRDAYHGLQAYTLGHSDPAFIHQHIVDAWAAQQADEHTKPITLTFALVGLFLRVERQFTGRRIQQVHAQLARNKEPWPPFALPVDRGELTPVEVMKAAPGAERDRAIDEWCASVWAAYARHGELVTRLLQRHQVIPAD